MSARRVEKSVFKDEKFLSLLEAAPDAMLIVDGRGMLIMVNSQLERLFGWPRAEILGKEAEILVPTRYHAKHEKHRQQYFSDPRVRPMGSNLELWGRRMDGSEFPVEISLSPLPTQEGVFTIAAVRDVTEQRRKDKKFRDLLEAAPDAIVVVDREGIIQLVNSQTGRMFGYEQSGLVGQPVETLIPKHFQKKHIRHRGHYQAEPHVRPMGAGLELFGVRKNGSEFPVEISLSPLETEEGPLVSAAIRDVTARKLIEADVQKLNEDLRQRASQLEAANKELEAFSYSVSHDLRAPLRSIDGFSQALLEDYGQLLPPEGRSYLERARAAAQRMAVLIDDLLNLSRLTRTPLQTRFINISAIAQDIIRSLQEGQPERRVKATVMPDLMVEGDPHLLHIALENLISNAWKFTAKREETVIEFGQKSRVKERTFFVRDNGAGFDMAYVDKLFGVFQRLHSASEYPGTGIGLATVQRIVKLHGGHIWAESEVGNGTTFYFTL